jgi:hypothetical protein
MWVMNRFGLKPEDYQMLQLVDVPNIFTAIVAGQIDAGALSPPTNFRARKAGLSELIDLRKDGPEYVSVAIGSRAYIETVPYVTRKGMETIIAELLPTEAKAKTAKPDDFLDTRFVSQLEREGFYRASASR